MHPNEFCKFRWGNACNEQKNKNKMQKETFINIFVHMLHANHMHLSESDA